MLVNRVSGLFPSTPVMLSPVGDTELDCIAAMRNNLDFWVIGQTLNDQVKNSEYFAGISENFYQVINYLN